MIWCARTPEGKLLWRTLSEEKEMVVYNLFGEMSEQFQRENWKDIEKSKKSYKKLGYRFVKVELKETTK